MDLKNMIEIKTEKIILELTEDEKGYLLIEMNMLLRSYRRDYGGKKFTNPVMGSAFNKVFKACADGQDHENIIRYRLE